MKLLPIGPSLRPLPGATARIAATIALAAFSGFGICRAQTPATSSDNRVAYLERIRTADSLYTASDFAAACATFDAAFRAYGCCILPYHLYNAACAAALAGSADAAFAWLRTRMEAEPGWYSDRIASDTDLAALHGDPRWQVLVDSLVRRQDRAERNFDHPLRQRLRELLDADQDVRIRYVAAARAEHPDPQLLEKLTGEMLRTDSANVRAVTEILDTRGWVDRETVGDVSAALFVILQHAEPAVQKRYLPLLREAVRRGELAPSSLALFEDRIAVSEGRPQRYGTQILQHNDGTYYVAPLENRDSLDAWRSRADLAPMETYVRRWNIEWKHE